MAFNFYHNACKILIVCFVSSFVFSADSTPVIDSITVINHTLIADNNATACKICLRVGGANFHNSLKVRPSPAASYNGDECVVDDQFSASEFAILWSNESSMVICNEFEEPLPSHEFALCILSVGDNVDVSSSKWLNQGSRALFRTTQCRDGEHNLLQPPPET